MEVNQNHLGRMRKTKRKTEESRSGVRAAMTPIADLSPHPKNYRAHPQDQLEHIKRSIQNHGVYRNIVAARGGVILAGHGVFEAAKQLGMTEIPVVTLDVDPDSPGAIALVVGDNEIGHLAEDDDRALSELLKSIKDQTGDLLGTGYDDKMLASLVFVTRPESEIPDKGAANAWAGMPEYDEGEEGIKLIVSFETQEHRDEFCVRGIVSVKKKMGNVWSAQYPPAKNFDSAAVRFDAEDRDVDGGRA